MKTLLIGAVLCVLSVPAFAAGGGTKDTPKCNKGYTWDQSSQSCVRSSSMNDDTLTEQGRRLALQGDYNAALDTLSYVQKPDSVTFTYLGYANRKLGRVDVGIGYYHQALAIDPANLNTREYLGEGYVSAGRVDLAVAELGKLEALCGTNCDQYEQLELTIAGTAADW